MSKRCRSIPLRLLLKGLFIVIQLFFVWSLVRLTQSSSDKKLVGVHTVVTTYSDFVTTHGAQVQIKPTTSEPTTSKPRSRQPMRQTKKLVMETTKKLVTETKKKPVIDMVNDYQPFLDFRFVFPEIIPTIKGSRNFFLIILVISAAKGKRHRERRDNIRRTWGSLTSCERVKAMNNSKIKNLKWKLVFVLGKAGPGDDKLNAEEAKRHNDILIGNIYDNYLNCVIKMFMGQLWASTFTAQFTLKTDDDVYLRIPGIIEYLVSENITDRDTFYGGETYFDHRVMRQPGKKWSISKKYFAEDMWPPFNGGAFYILSTNLLERLFNYIHIRKPFHLDDAYVGLAMRDFKVNVTDILSFDVKRDMAQHLREINNCEILAIIAFGHSIDPESSKILHNRLESMCSKNITKKSC